MAPLFDIDKGGLKKYRQFLKKAPRAARKAVAWTLNGFTLGSRRHSLKITHSELTMRNQKFIDSSMKTAFAKPSKQINKMESIFGSVERPRYTGLREQQTGEQPKQKNTTTRAARGGVKRRQVKSWARMRANAKFPSPNKTQGLKTRDGRDYGLSGLTGPRRIVAFLSILNERKVAQTFILRKSFGRFKRGLYRFQQGVIKKLQSFGTRGKPKRVKWLTKGVDNYLKSININKVWSKNLLNELKKIR